MKEIWKDIKGYEGEYQVSTKGRIKSLERNIEHLGGIRKVNEKILKQNEDLKGYKRITIKGKAYRIHRLVGLTFIPNSYNKEQINHIDGNKANNNVDNLEWCSNSENQIHAVNNGLKKKFNHTKETKKRISNTLKSKNLDFSYNSKVVVMFGKKDHNKIKEFKSINKANEYLRNNGYPKAQASAISKSCHKIKGHFNGNCYGHYWEFKNN